MSTRVAPKGATRMWALIQELELRRGELDKLVGPMPANGQATQHLQAALIELDGVIKLLRAVPSKASYD